MGSDILGSPDIPDANPLPKEPEYVFWYHTGRGSVFFYPPGSIQEHLVTEHGIDSLEVLRHTKGHRDHARDHSKQAGVAMGAVGDLPAVRHAHEEGARAPSHAAQGCPTHHAGRRCQGRVATPAFGRDWS